MRSPSCNGTGTPVGISLPLTIVPFSEPGSITDQPITGSAIRTACRREMPGSSGGPVRSISGVSPREALRRPIRISRLVSANRRSGQYGGERDQGCVGPARPSHGVVVVAVGGGRNRPAGGHGGVRRGRLLAGSAVRGGAARADARLRPGNGRRFRGRRGG